MKIQIKMKSKLLKALCTLVIVFMTAIVAYAESIPVKKNSETIGYVTLSYDIQESRGGSFVKVTVSNGTKESVSFYVTTNKGGGTTISLRGYEDKTVTFGLNDVPTKVYAVGDYIPVR